VFLNFEVVVKKCRYFVYDSMTITKIHEEKRKKEKGKGTGKRKKKK
jgi:hypothetical protein